MKSWIIPNGCGLLFYGRLLFERVPGVLGGVLGLLANLPRGALEAFALTLGLQVRVTGRPASSWANRSSRPAGDTMLISRPAGL